jgi:hypothetical protein
MTVFASFPLFANTRFEVAAKCGLFVNYKVQILYLNDSWIHLLSPSAFVWMVTTDLNREASRAFWAAYFFFSSASL